MRRTSFSSLPRRRANSLLLMRAAVKELQHRELGGNIRRNRDVDEAAGFGTRLGQRLAALQITQEHKAERLLGRCVGIGFATALRDRLGHIGEAR